jgi:hypothetical protein
MLSHPAHEESEETAVAAATSLLHDHESAGNRRRHLTVADVFGHFDREFFRSWFIEGPRLLFAGRFNHREGVFIALASVPAILAATFLLLPGFLFDTPEYHVFYEFARSVKEGNASLLPMAIGTLSSLFSLRVPHGS